MIADWSVWLARPTKIRITATRIVVETRWSIVTPVMIWPPYPSNHRDIVPLGNFSAPTRALLELLTKVEFCHTALLPRTTEVEVETFAARKRFICRTLLEFDPPPDTICSVAFPV